MTDWLVSPIFFAQLVALILLFFPHKKIYNGFHLRHAAFILLFIITVFIVISLYHDSTDSLNLYF